MESSPLRHSSADVYSGFVSSETPPHERPASSYMDSSSNTVAFEGASAAIARGEVGANYSRYSVPNMPGFSTSDSPHGSSARLSTLGGSQGRHGSDDEILLETGLPEVPYGSRPKSMARPWTGSSRSSEYGPLATGGLAIDSPDYRGSFYDSSIGHESAYLGKPKEDVELLWNEKNIEADDFLHDPRTLEYNRAGGFWRNPTSKRGAVNVLGLCVLLAGFLALFMGWPIHTYLIANRGGTGFGWNMGGTNASGQVPDIPNLPGLIDMDTPEDIRNNIRTGFNGREYELVFSDEFNVDDRTFWPGDDPFWEAVDIHYWQTRDLEWYDPDAVTTKDGHLLITLSEQPIKGLNFRSGMIQSWNKLCFNEGAYIEISISLPGTTTASGYWPGAWTMGNLGRAGYGATNDGMWPYSYNECDVGTLRGQNSSETEPAGAFDSGATDYNGRISILAGQRASACTCKGEQHPGPKNNVGRGAPEIDILEAMVDWRGYGTASQSIQIAPFDYRWNWDNETEAGMVIYDRSVTTMNAWKGAATQEAASAVTRIGTEFYGGQAFTSYGYELVPGGGSDSQITWQIGGQPTWTLKAGAFPPDDRTKVGQRLMSEEPMYMIINLAISSSFQALQFDRLEFPGTMHVDYVRVWQEKGKTDVSCDPKDHPTAKYIDKYMEYYTNPNITTWPRDLWPKNSLVDDC